jgi:hypothetical protein
MPCNSDYLEPTHRERELQRTAKLLLYVYAKIGAQPETWIGEQAKNIYASDSRLVPLLCAGIKKMSKMEKEKIIYNAHDKNSRDLADWWDVHKEADREREEREQIEKTHDKFDCFGTALSKDNQRIRVFCRDGFMITADKKDVKIKDATHVAIRKGAYLKQ